MAYEYFNKYNGYSRINASKELWHRVQIPFLIYLCFTECILLTDIVHTTVSGPVYGTNRLVFDLNFAAFCSYGLQLLSNV